jgi:hypothetical protein
MNRSTRSPMPGDLLSQLPATLATAGLGVLMGLGYAWRRRRAA